MELIEIWQLVRRWWWLIAIPTVITTLAAIPALPGAISPPETYGATIRFTAAAPPDAQNELAAATDPLTRSGTYEDTSYVPWLASEYVVVNLPSWITSSRFAIAVSDELAGNNINITADDVRLAFNADSVRSIFTVYYGWDDETELEAIANASISILQNQSDTVFPQLATEPAIIIPLDDVEIVRTVPPLAARLRPFITIFAGLVIGIGLAVLAAYTDDIVRTPDDLEGLAIPVIGHVPRA